LNFSKENMVGFYPALLDLTDRLTLLVGGGRVAGRKLASLLEAGARVRLVSPELAESCKEQLGPRVEYHARGFEPSDFDGVCLAVSATDHESINRAVADEAGRRNVFVNVVDVPPLCSFIVPAVVRRGELCIAIGTGGAAPAVSRGIRRSLQCEYGPEWEPYLKVMRAVRGHVLAKGRPSHENRPYFEALAQAPLLDYIKDQDLAGLEKVLAGILKEPVTLGQLGLVHLLDMENGT
jgi:precorrin-2 dehydrogenase/sirohydrochlorin ferrochelatase